MPASAPNKPKVILLCGLTGAGKTTLARRLEQELGAVHFSADAWMIALYGHHMPREVFDARLQVIKDLIWGVAGRLLVLDTPVILDFGFWKREERLLYKQKCEEAGAEALLYYLEVPLEVLQIRLAARNASLPEGSYEVTPEMLVMFASWFEPPSEDEGLTLVQS